MVFFTHRHDREEANSNIADGVVTETAMKNTQTGAHLLRAYAIEHAPRLRQSWFDDLTEKEKNYGRLAEEILRAIPLEEGISLPNELINAYIKSKENRVWRSTIRVKKDLSGADTDSGVRTAEDALSAFILLSKSEDFSELGREMRRCRGKIWEIMKGHPFFLSFEDGTIGKYCERNAKDKQGYAKQWTWRCFNQIFTAIIGNIIEFPLLRDKNNIQYGIMLDPIAFKGPGTYDSYRTSFLEDHRYLLIDCLGPFGGNSSTQHEVVSSVDEEEGPLYLSPHRWGARRTFPSYAQRELDGPVKAKFEEWNLETIKHLLAKAEAAKAEEKTTNARSSQPDITQAAKLDGDLKEDIQDKFTQRNSS